ncbi:thioredoxin family protein [Thiolapillus brandeum]|uniref:Thioredoxin/glutaredoxin n=1 Tax=Thiolapillus brandeum TaxID=1076588 RepID=A0A7U6GJ62_9GAMM|nr:thioredoxin family protein [Thiolapillus brandeum]BAO44540.1 thioredoxin/glutaredoxin [Thiolapillus brandeum]
MSIEVEIFSAPGCGKCGKAKHVLKRILDEWEDGRVQWREVNILDELDYAVSLGVLSTPAIAVDGELVFTALPSEKRLRRLLQERLEALKS